MGASELKLTPSGTDLELGYVFDDFLFQTSMDPELRSNPFVNTDDMLYHGDFVPAVLQTPVTMPVNLGLGNGTNLVNGATLSTSSVKSEPTISESEFLDTVMAALKGDDALLREFVKQSATAGRAGPSNETGSYRQYSSVNANGKSSYAFLLIVVHLYVSPDRNSRSTGSSPGTSKC